MSQERVPQLIPGYGGSKAYLSADAPADTAVIFVHGFLGHPSSTWGKFVELVREYTPDYPWWARSDMYFYTYDSLDTPIRRNAELLYDFSKTVWFHSWQAATVPARTKYKDLILAGHSEGGVLIRRMVLDRYESLKLATEAANPGVAPDALDSLMASALTADFILTAHLRLFAPACMGTNFSSYAAALSFPLVAAAVAANSLVLGELLPDSPVLHNLQRGTEMAHERLPHVQSLFVQPLFGIPDEIVYSESYNGEKLLWERELHHRDVCKPTVIYKRPLEFVRK